MARSGFVYTGHQGINWTGERGNSTETSDIAVAPAADMQSANLELKKQLKISLPID